VIHEQEKVIIIGHNGSGKSTTINCLLSLLNFDNGSIKIFNEEMHPNAYDIKRKIGVVFQEVAVFDELTVYDNINYFNRIYYPFMEPALYGMTDKTAADAARKTLEFYQKYLKS